MKRLAWLLAALTGLAVLPGPARAEDAAPLIGEGSSYPGGLFDDIANGFHETKQTLIDYTAVGSHHGREAFLEGEVDFALSDLPFHPDEAAKAASDGREYAYAPLFAGPLPFVFHVDTTEGPLESLRLSPVTLAKIFTTSIGNWRAEALTQDNGAPINAARGGNLGIFFRSDTNGLTWALSNWVQTLAPAEWKSFTTLYKLPDEPVERWPSQNLLQSVQAAEFAAQRIREDPAPNAITYLPPAYVARDNLQTIAVKNKSGNYVLPSPEGGAKGLAAGEFDPATGVFTPNYEPDDPAAYPLCLVTYAIVPLNKTTPEKQLAIAEMLRYVLDQEEKGVAVGYSALPAPMAQRTEAVIAQLEAAAASSASTTTTTGGSGNSSTTSSSAPSSTTSTTAASSAASLSSTTTTSAASAGTVGSGGSGTQVLGETLAFTGALAWEWKLPLGLLLAASGEILRRRRATAPVGSGSR